MLHNSITQPLDRHSSQTHTHVHTQLMELAISQVPVMVNAALFSSVVKLIFRFQVTRHWQRADPLLTEMQGEREGGRHTIQHNFLSLHHWHT